MGENNEALSIFKNDSTFQIGSQSIYYELIWTNTGTTQSNPPTVIVRDANYKKILTEVDTTFGGQSGSTTGLGVTKCYAKHCYGTTTTTSFSPPIAGIPRDSDIVIELIRDGETKSYLIHTPKHQINYFIEHKPDKSGYSKCVGTPNEVYKVSGVKKLKCGQYSFETTPIFEVFTSNFGYDSDSTIWASSIVRDGFDNNGNKLP